jgi:phosphate acyltransferase
MRIILDGMGSDNHPIPEVKAAVRAAKEFSDKILLVGDQKILSPLLEKENPENHHIEIIHAPETFKFTSKISSKTLKTEKNSIGVGMELLRDKQGDLLVTAGNTGGAMAIGLTRLRRIKGLKRPALTYLFPTRAGFCCVADIGANAECKPEYLVQFAQMGNAYIKSVTNIVSPRIGLLSNGEEEGKGNDLVKNTYKLMEKEDFNFIGNVESKEVYQGLTDVVVTDGFTGNIFLKTSEATAKFLMDLLKEELMSSPISIIGGLLAKKSFKRLQKRMDPEYLGAAPLLGLNGLVFVSHGRSNSTAIFNSIRVARKAAQANLLENIISSIHK